MIFFFPAFIQKFREFIGEQENEIERAVIGRGKYEFRRQYCYMQVAETEWFAMNTSQRAKHLQKVSSLTLSDIGDSSSDTSHLLCSRNPDMAALSVDLSVLVGTAKLPQTVLEGIWNKASELLKTDGAIVSAPGLGGGAKYVMSYGGSKPHLVTLKKGGSVCCDADCPNWKGLGICSHVVAVAEYCGVLTQLIANFKKAKKFPNLSKLAEATLPKGSGRKGGEKPRSRKACVQVESRVENPSLGTSARLPSSSQASSWAPSLQQDPSVAMEGFSSPGLPTYPTSWPPPPQPQILTQTVSPVLSSTMTFTPPSQCSNYGFPPLPSSFPHFPRPPLPSIFELCRIAGNISVCAGCRNKYLKTAQPPYDLCIRHQEWREYTSPMSPMPQSRFGNVYYHFNPGCVQVRVPNFIPSTLHVPEELSAQLTSAHKQHLSAYFNISVP